MPHKTRNLILCALFAALIVLCTYIRLDLGVIAFTLQTLAVLLAAILLGPVNGVLSVALYLLLGLIGLPVFTSGGGLGAFLTPSFGFAIGFLPMAYLTGALAQKADNRFSKLLLAGVVGTLPMYLIGLGYGYLILNVYLGKGMSFAALLWSLVGMFVPVDFAKCVIAALAGAKLRPILEKIH